jgi:hypothetical protein
MLRRSTGVSEEIKRVGVSRGMDIWMGAENWRKFAVARLRSTEDDEVASSVLVGMQGLSDAIDCRSSTRGSCWAASEVAIVVDVMRQQLSRLRLRLKSANN